MREEYGMQLDDSFYVEAINDFKNSFRQIFADEMILNNEYCFFETRGRFKLNYKFRPLNYNVIVENELRTFTIMIEDSEKAKNSLYRIENFDNQLCKRNIENSLKILKKVLDRNEFDLFIYCDSKLYKKNSNGVKRVKDMRELIRQ